MGQFNPIYQQHVHPNHRIDYDTFIEHLNKLKSKKEPSDKILHKLFVFLLSGSKEMLEYLLMDRYMFKLVILMEMAELRKGEDNTPLSDVILHSMIETVTGGNPDADLEIPTRIIAIKLLVKYGQKEGI